MREFEAEENNCGNLDIDNLSTEELEQLKEELERENGLAEIELNKVNQRYRKLLISEIDELRAELNRIYLRICKIGKVKFKKTYKYSCINFDNFTTDELEKIKEELEHEIGLAKIELNRVEKEYRKQLISEIKALRAELNVLKCKKSKRTQVMMEGIEENK